ncbi:hypothetical protein CAC42_7233 [Sphaceloma murrayae]|uniref:GRIP domain-containing protein n=1 Tax=Sphaceloma murrayae TaxID=2082308 RepID=A0A2K1QQC5_9PEZI|nr:hypothetical protein CAC42_7233 [Sphaceloma murrayae]
MFNRFKNFNLDSFLDSKIAEEQARQQQGQAPGLRRQPSAAKRANGGTASPSRRTSSRTRDGDRTPAPKGPDPSEFVIDDDETSSRVPTPRPPETTKAEKAAEEISDGDSKPAQTEDVGEAKVGEAKGTATDMKASEKPADDQEIPQEIQVKLRRLQKLESKYNELLRSYRVAHARVSAIEPFEASLRENTPLTSINEPSALVEYLSQVNLKGDMIMSELKKVTEDRNAIKSKLDKAQKEAESRQVSSETVNKGADGSKGDARNEDDFFSYESEVPRLQDELQGKVQRIDELMQDNETLRKELEAMREENKQESMSGKRAAGKSDGEMDHLLAENKALQERIKQNENTLREIESAASDSETDLELQSSSDEALVVRVRRIASTAASSRSSSADSAQKVQDLMKRLAEAEQKVKDANDNLASVELGSQEARASSTKRLGTLDDLVKTLRGQLTEAETARKELESDLHDTRSNLESLKSEAESRVASSRQGDEAANDLKSEVSRLERELDGAYELLASTGIAAELEDVPAAPAEPVTVSDNATSAPSEAIKADGAAKKKKKNNKKKKTGASQATEETAVVAPSAATSPRLADEPTPRNTSITTISRLTPEQLSTLRARINKSTTHNHCEATISSLRTNVARLDTEISEKMSIIDKLHSRLKGEEDLKEEIEGLKDDLMHIGHSHVVTKEECKQIKSEREKAAEEYAEAIKELEEKLEVARKRVGESESEMQNLKAKSGQATEAEVAGLTREKAKLEEAVGLLEKERDEVKGKSEEMERELKESKSKTVGMQTDLNAANELAQTRFKDLTALRDRLGKIQPEVNNLRAETDRLKGENTELKKENEKLKGLEGRAEILGSEITDLKSKLAGKEGEVKTLMDKVRKAEERATELEEKESKASKASTRAETSAKEAIEAKDKATKELNAAKTELESVRTKLGELEGQAAGFRQEVQSAKEEAQLKSAQQASAQSLMESMQDQTRELATQMKEVRARCDGLEEELADSQRLLMERSREGETMRRLLADVEGRAEARVKEMRERMDLAVEERDRAEEDASAVTRRRAREVDELRSKLKEAEKAKTLAVDEREDFERRGRSLETQKEDLERKTSEAQRELDEIRTAMTQLRDALDDGERQTRELERERADLKKTLEEKEKRLDKLQKGSKTMADELKSLQAARTKQLSSTPSNRSSMDSSRITSPTLNGSATGTGAKQGEMDYVYLKNVLLQFLEQRDKKHQMQLVPVLGMLLHFDRKDEQKWMTAINATK